MPRRRTFLAVEITPTARAAAVELQRTLNQTTGAAVNWVAPANLHITLQFLGEVEARELVPLCRLLEQVAKTIDPFALRLKGISAFPTPRRPKTLFAAITEGSAELIALHAALQPPLLDLGVTRQEDRSFTPHLTLGRVKGEEAGDKLAAELPRHAHWSGGVSGVTELVLFTSELRRGGPEYSAVSRAELGRPG